MWLWMVSSIAGSLLGAASTKWFKDTKAGLWCYAKFEQIAEWATERYGIDRAKMKLFDAEDSAQDLVSDGSSTQQTDSKPSWGDNKDNVVSYRNKKKPDFGGLK